MNYNELDSLIEVTRSNIMHNLCYFTILTNLMINIY
jgi:hypothetical protein